MLFREPNTHISFYRYMSVFSFHMIGIQCKDSNAIYSNIFLTCKWCYWDTNHYLPLLTKLMMISVPSMGWTTLSPTVTLWLVWNVLSSFTTPLSDVIELYKLNINVGAESVVVLDFGLGFWWSPSKVKISVWSSRLSRELISCIFSICPIPLST